MNLPRSFYRKLDPSTLWLRASLLACFILCCSAPFATATAADEPSQAPTITALQVGFDGHYKVGYWTSVRVTVRGGNEAITGQLELSVMDGDNTSSTVRSGPQQLLPGKETVITSYVKFGQPDGDLQLAFRTDAGAALERTIDMDPDADGLALPIALQSDELLYVMIGPSLGVEDAIIIQERDHAAKITLVKLADAAELPHRWYGYDGVDALFCATSQPELYRSLRPDSAGLAALNKWVELGGTLVLSAGANPEAVQAQGPFAALTPGKIEKIASLRTTVALESYSGGSQQVPISQSGERLEIAVPQLSEPRGVVEVVEAGLPLVVRSPFGLGEVVFVALNLDQTPLAGWSGRGALVNRLLRKTPIVASSSGATATGSNAQHLGFDDLTGQLRGALDQFSGVQVVSFGTIFGILCLYILLIGPIDYLIVKKLFRRMETTWITFPLTVVVFSIAAYYLANWSKGDQLRVNQAELVDVDLETGLVRGTTWAHLFTPDTTTYNLSLKTPADATANATDQPVLLSWLGLPGAGLGGMEPGGIRPRLFTRSYSYSAELDQMLGVPVAVWSTKSLTARWHQHGSSATALETDLTADLDQALQGSVTNGTTQSLTNCILVYDRWAYLIGNLEPGQSARLGAGDRQLDLQTVLKEITLEKNAKDSYGSRSTPYDPASQDVLKILRHMMFYEVSGGANYTGLSNSYQSFTDGSAQLAMQRAILFGEVKQTTTELLNDGAPLQNAAVTHWALYRFMIPVEQLENEE